ncbi:hypothetical protein [Pelotalea chapellei]|uniref:Photosystem I assembly protein Ycf4 n=1 Tax=Pelotalea chapellei TaxID=44671 RepID=A0ABS5U5X6_9BACT|nr:hypothetical protein [Pelotalea chapellei]MBT1071068.1 hypothetical protein [Pelotalea chapellei]
MAATNKQQTWSGVNNESKRTTEEEGRGKVVCPLNVPSEKNPAYPIVLKYKHLFYFFVMFALAGCYVFAVFGSIIPYLSTGNLAAIWPTNEGSLATKSILFILSWILVIYSPTIIQIYRMGDVIFYKTCVEVNPYLRIFEKRTIYYESMHVKVRGDRAMFLTNSKPPLWTEDLFNYWKSIYWDGIVVTFTDMVVEDSESISQATKIIKEKATSITSF